MNKEDFRNKLVFHLGRLEKSYTAGARMLGVSDRTISLWVRGVSAPGSEVTRKAMICRLARFRSAEEARTKKFRSLS